MAGLQDVMAQPEQPGAMPAMEGPERASAAVPEGVQPVSQDVSPEEQAQYERFYGMAASIIRPRETDEVSPQILANLRGEFAPEALELFAASAPGLTDSPQDSVAATGVIVTMLAEQSLGEDVSDDVVMFAGPEILGELTEIAEAAKIHDFDEREVEGIWYRALDLYRTASPRADPETLSKGFEMVMAADKAGRLNDVLTGSVNTIAPGLPGGAPLPASQGENGNAGTA